LDNPKGYKKAKQRQSYILGRMVEDGYVTQSDADEAKAADLDWVSRFEGDEFLAAEYFVEEARKKIYKLYGQDELYDSMIGKSASRNLSGQKMSRIGVWRQC